MLLVLIAATSLLIQAYAFRDTPAHPFDRCATDRSLCPEESLDSLLAAHEARVAGLRVRALGAGAAGASAVRSPDGIDVSRIGSRGAGE